MFSDPISLTGREREREEQNEKGDGRKISILDYRDLRPAPNFQGFRSYSHGESATKEETNGDGRKKLRWGSKNCDPQLQDSAGFVEACWTRRMVWRFEVTRPLCGLDGPRLLTPV
jgi:hypothetical protein